MFVLIVSVLLLTALVMSLPEQGGNAFDRSMEAWMAGFKSDGMTVLFKLFSQLGSTIAIIGITLISALVIGWMRGWLRGASFMAGVAAAYLLNSLLKMWIDRSRPAVAWGIEADGASFPSANAMLAIVMYGLLANMIIQSSSIRGGFKFAAIAVAALLILMMGLCRVYFHVHYLTDIMGGYAAGLAVISILMMITYAFNKNRGAA
ncbi:undecaprenyl-diphosphatase [Paenibacillus prosopidis]|uniref:Undecaprenyl-diphosphatase n=2 Tax=Paenibacillus prosopidis TaxID=630520 RepID=A0A368W6G8_9BACL|nr:undecaprenyl-diphosphatase [Paenibacillus prosopidis]